jgi:uncharacterized NAD(P)/FAD-binding protein YdhS
MISRPLTLPSVAIVGGGFSGTLVLANLVRETQTPLAIELFEASGNMATGTAYGTIDIAHLLNVRTDRLGAFSDQPEGFYTWLHDEAGKTQVNKLWPGYEIRADGYAPRLLYATYLKHIVEETLRLAREKGIDVRVHHAKVTDVQQSGQLLLTAEKNGKTQTMFVDALVLATGNLPPRRFAFEPALAGDVRYIPDIWNPAADVILHDVRKLPASSHIVIIGTGLTAIDAILTLEEEEFRGTMIAISRRGLLPATHISLNKQYPHWDLTLRPERITTALGLLVRLRQEIRAAKKQGYDWRSVIDSLRPVTQTLWKQLRLSERRKFLDKLATLWNIHRHRMAPEVGMEIARLQNAGRLKVVAGKVTSVGKAADGLEVSYHTRDGQRSVQAALVINCTGPEYNLKNSLHPLLNRLCQRGLITPHPLNTGTAKGSRAIFPIGTLLIGELLECMAVPELRDQAMDVARAVLQRVEYMAKNELMVAK